MPIGKLVKAITKKLQRWVKSVIHHCNMCHWFQVKPLIKFGITQLPSFWTSPTWVFETAAPNFADPLEDKIAMAEHKKSISSIINLQSWRRSRETHTVLPVHTSRVAIKHTIGHTCELQLIIPIKTNIGRIFWTQFYYCKPSLYFIFTDNFWCAQQTIVFIMHNNLLDSTKGIPILLIPRKWCGCFNLEDWTNLQQKKRKIAL